MVLFENVHVFNSRTELNFLHQVSYKNSTYLIVLVIFTQLLHVSCMHIGFMQDILSLEPVSFTIWFYLFIVALSLVFVMEIEKWIRKRKYGFVSTQT